KPSRELWIGQRARQRAGKLGPAGQAVLREDRDVLGKHKPRPIDTERELPRRRSAGFTHQFTVSPDQGLPFLELQPVDAPASLILDHLEVQSVETGALAVRCITPGDHSLSHLR